LNRNVSLIAEVSLVVASRKSAMHNVKGKRIVVEKKSAAKPHTAVESGTTITIDRRGNRDRRVGGDRRSHSAPVAVERRGMERRVKVNRRRQIDPTTCERDYTGDEIEFMSAIEQYKRHSGRMFPTCSEVLEVLKSLGYQKYPTSDPAALPVAGLPGAVFVDSPNPAIV
jgi:hypothetical protein